MWKKGPLPPGTYFWGAVVEAGKDPTKGFHFADFHGNHVILYNDDNTKLEPHQVGYYRNDINVLTKEEVDNM